MALLSDLQNGKKSNFKGSKIQLSKLSEIKDGYIFKDYSKYDELNMYHSTEKINTTLSDITGKNTKEKIEDPKILIVEEKIHKVYKIMLTDYLSNLQSLQSFIDQYPSLESVSRSKNLWKMYTMLKK